MILVSLYQFLVTVLDLLVSGHWTSSMCLLGLFVISLQSGLARLNSTYCSCHLILVNHHSSWSALIQSSSLLVGSYYALHWSLNIPHPSLAGTYHGPISSRLVLVSSWLVFIAVLRFSLLALVSCSEYSALSIISWHIRSISYPPSHCYHQCEMKWLFCGFWSEMDLLYTTLSYKWLLLAVKLPLLLHLPSLLCCCLDISFSQQINSLGLAHAVYTSLIPSWSIRVPLTISDCCCHTGSTMALPSNGCPLIFLLPLPSGACGLGGTCHNVFLQVFLIS